jgi:hypothetical protein
MFASEKLSFSYPFILLKFGRLYILLIKAVYDKVGHRESLPSTENHTPVDEREFVSDF